ncbi:MAG: NAD(P)H-hydrate dehydratase [Hymenobacteraceae bacterium]|nr:NAD(P)H-hydrate dehydratase [Hymenobacteraceae bacterium]
MQILSAAQLKAADALTCHSQQISSLELMERAAKAAAETIEPLIKPPYIRPLVICCGPGNNGGDGLAVARLLYSPAYGPHIAVWRLPAERYSADNEANRFRLPDGIAVIELTAELPPLPPDAIVVDALFGTGLTRPLDGLAAALVRQLNASGAEIISLDVPSGLPTDAAPAPDAAIVRATQTLTFGALKLPFLLPGLAEYVGEWHLLDINLDLSQTESAMRLTEAADLAPLLAPRHRFGHKGTYGHALLLAGSRGKLGAAVLAARACLRAGVGLLTVQVPAVGYGVLQTSVPEAMALTDPMADYLSALPDDADLGHYQALGIGPGLGQHADTALLLRELLDEARRRDLPTVLDADALNILAAHPAWRHHLPARTVLTPHPKEFARLAGAATDDFARLEKLKAYAADTGAVVLLKGAYSVVATPAGELYFNSTGNPGMATGGTGDVLTGVILSLLAQGLNPLDAARFGAFIHGRAGDLAAAKHGERGLIAGDVAEYVGRAFLKS